MLFLSLLLVPALATSVEDATVPFNSWNNTVDTLQYGLAFIVVLVAAHPLGLIFPKFFKLPLITGYLVIGIIAGPFVTNLLPQALVELLSTYVSALALSFISFQAGQEIYLPELRPQLKQIFILLSVLYVTAMVTLTSVHLLANDAFFYDDFVTNCQLGIALMFGSISVLGSPATVMAIKIELNSVGPFTNLMLGVTMMAEFIVLVSFSISRMICLINCADLQVSVGNIVFTLTIVVSNLLLGGFIGLVIVLIFEIPGSTADEHLDLHESCVTTLSNENLETSHDGETILHPHNGYVEETDGERKPRKTPVFWTTQMSLYVKGFLWLTLGHVFYIATTTISEATIASFGASWEVRFEPLLVLMVASCLAGHYSLIRHDMHVILDSVAPYMFLPFFVMTGAALKLDMVVKALPLMSLYVCLRFVTVFIACYLGGRFLLHLTPRQYNNLWLTLTPQAGVALGLADEMKTLSSDPWAGEFAVTIVAAVVVNQIIGPVLCALGLGRAGESLYDRAQDGVDNSDIQSSVNGERAQQSRGSSNTTQNNDDPRTLLPFHDVKSAVVIGEDEVAFEIAVALSLYGAQVDVPLLDKEQADKWQTVSENMPHRSAKYDLIQFKKFVNERECEEHLHEMSLADVSIFTGDGKRTLEYVRAMKTMLGEAYLRVIAVVPDCIYSKELKKLGVLIVQPSIALATIATRMALLDQKHAESLSKELSATSDFVTAVESLSNMRREGRRLALGRSVVKHHAANYDRLAEILAAENLPMPPPPLRVSMFGTSCAGFDPFSRRGNGMSAYEHFVVENEPTVNDSTVFDTHFVQRSAGRIAPRLGISPSPQGSNPYAFVGSRSSGRLSYLNLDRGSVQRGHARSHSNV